MSLTIDVDVNDAANLVTSFAGKTNMDLRIPISNPFILNQKAIYANFHLKVVLHTSEDNGRNRKYTIT